MGGFELMSIQILVVAATQPEADKFRSKHIGEEFTVYTNINGRSLASLGNEFIERSMATVVGMVHADVWFGSNATQAFYDCASTGNICGIVGRALDSIENDGYKWCCTHYTSTGVPNQKPNPGDVSTLDCCSVFFRKDLGLHFDEKIFDGYHLHIEDLCLQAQARKIPVVVPLAEGCGHPLLCTRGPDWINDYWMYRKRLATKWMKMRFITT
jgi:hypothetical protein